MSKSSKATSSKVTTRKSAAEPRPAKRKKIVSLAQYEAEAAAELQDAATAAPDGAGAKGPVEPDQDARPRGKRPSGEHGATSRGPSGLDAAVTVLAEAGEPLNTKTMVERMLAKGLWSTGGKTPAATIYSAILREITVKGPNARFRRVDRGRFGLAK